MRPRPGNTYLFDVQCVTAFNMSCRYTYDANKLRKCSTWNISQIRHQRRDTTVTYPNHGPKVTLYLGDYALPTEACALTA